MTLGYVYDKPMALLSNQQKAILRYYLRDFRFIGIFLIILLIGVTTLVAQYQQNTKSSAASTATFGSLTLTTTMNSIGIEVAGNTVASGSARFKKTADTTWRNGLDLWQAGGALYGSALLLEPGTSYDIEVTPQGGTTLSGTITTQPDINTTAALTPTHCVNDTTGSDTNNGLATGGTCTAAAAWKTLSKAASAANSATADMVIQVAGGYYKSPGTQINPPSGRKIIFAAENPALDDNGNPINSVAAGQAPKRAIIEPNTLSSPASASPTDSAGTTPTPWVKVSPGLIGPGNGGAPAGTYTNIWKWTNAPTVGSQIGYVATRGGVPKRLAGWRTVGPYLQTPESWAELVNTNKTYNYGYYIPSSTRDMYLRLPNDEDPNTYFFFIGGGTAFDINSANVRVSGFEIKGLIGVKITSSANNTIIDHNYIASGKYGVEMAGNKSVTPNTYSKENLLERNRFEDTSLWETDPTKPKAIPWMFIKDSITVFNGKKYTDPTIGGSVRIGEESETTAVFGSGFAQRSTIRKNTIIGPFNGIGVYNSQFDRYSAQDIDIYDNTFSQIADDSLEPEQNVINWRMWNNTFREIAVVMSTGPVNYGPLYFFKNQAFRISAAGVGIDAANGQPGAAAVGFKYSNASYPNARIFVLHNTFWTDYPGPSGNNSNPIGATGGDSAAGGGCPIGITPGTCGENFYMRNNMFRASNYAFRAPNNTPVPRWDEAFNHFATTNSAQGLQYAGIRYTTNVGLYKTVSSQGVNTNLTGDFVTTSVVDNAFNNPSSGDFTLKSTVSTFTDQGNIVPNISDIAGFHYQGNAPDMGACEGSDCVAKLGGSVAVTPTAVVTPLPTAVTTPVPTAAVKTATLSLSPVTGSVQMVDPITGLPTLTVAVLINTGGASVTNVDLSLTFDPVKLQVVSVTPGSFLPSAQTVGGLSHVLDNTSGVIKESIYTLSGGQSGSGTLATIVLTGKAVTTTPTAVAFDTALTIVYGTNTGNVFLSGTGASYSVIAAPTVTSVPPTSTPVAPTSTPVPPTVTPVPPTPTVVVPTSTPVVPTSTPTIVPTATPVPVAAVTMTTLLQGISSNVGNQTATLQFVSTAPTGQTYTVASQSLIADSFGQYSATITNIAYDTYSLFVKIPGYLRKRYTVTINATTIPLNLTSSPLLGGDVVDTGNNTIDASDLSRIIQDYTITTITPADINKDSIVNALDIGLVINNYLSIGD